eukprot:COSAG05_NODE_14506_length_395_cov_0.658784_1_plen_38_part_01
MNGWEWRCKKVHMLHRLDSAQPFIGIVAQQCRRQADYG